MRPAAGGISAPVFDSVRALISERTGLVFSASRLDELRSVLTERLAARTECRDFAEYDALLRSATQGEFELRALVTRLTVGETYFFRHRAQFSVLRNHLLPELIGRRRERRRLRLWSAGCATGEEAYSLAILLCELLPDAEGWDLLVLGTDINQESLAAARGGSYRNWSFREVEEYYRRRYFVPEGGLLRIRPEVQRLVSFRYLNLAEDVYPAAATGTDGMDLIVCRNVMIYFRPELSHEITARFFRSLADDGSLIVGHSEHHEMVCEGFVRKSFGKVLVYRKPEVHPSWEKPIAIRMRGAGPPARGAVCHAPRPARQPVERPADSEETRLFARAAAFLEEHRHEDAVGAFRELLAHHPRNVRALYTLARLLADAGELAEAGDWLEKLLEVDPLHLEAVYLDAIIARETGQRERELSFLKRALYLNPGFVLGHFQLGVHHLRGGNRRLAERSLLNVLTLLRDRSPQDRVEGVEGMTVGLLREAVRGMYPGKVPEGLR